MSSEKLTEYVFARRTYNLPDGIDHEKTFWASSYLEALQQASDYWFSGERVVAWFTDKNSVVTMLSGNASGNVIGILVDGNN